MRGASKKTLKGYWDSVPETKGPLTAWFKEVSDASWASPAELKAKYASASILKDGRAVFNVCGNNYRLVVWINYDFRIVYVRFIGTHKEYDRIDAETV
jgi:mRNA interferase HigB